MLILRKDLYSHQDAESLLASFERLVKESVDNPSMELDQPEAYEPAGVDWTLAFGRGAEKERL